MMKQEDHGLRRLRAYELGQNVRGECIRRGWIATRTTAEGADDESLRIYIGALGNRVEAVFPCDGAVQLVAVSASARKGRSPRHVGLQWDAVNCRFRVNGLEPSPLKPVDAVMAELRSLVEEHGWTTPRPGTLTSTCTAA